MAGEKNKNIMKKIKKEEEHLLQTIGDQRKE